MFFIETKIKEKKLIPGTFDPVFKEIFTCKECRNYTCALISEITSIDINYLKKHLRVVNTTLPIQRFYEKGSDTDVLLSIEKNIINIEMNNDYYDGVYEKNDLYGHKVLGRTMTRGEEYKNYKTLIQINIDNFDKFKKTISKFRMMEVETGEFESRNYIKYRINLPKIIKKYYNKEKLSYLEKLVLVIGLSKTNDLERISVGDETIMEYEKKIKHLSDDDRFVDLYDREAAAKLEQELKEKYRIKIATKEGREKGIKEGIKEGIKQEKLEIARNMLNKDMDLKLISELIGISEKELKDIK